MDESTLTSNSADNSALLLGPFALVLDKRVRAFSRQTGGQVPGFGEKSGLWGAAHLYLTLPGRVFLANYPATHGIWPQVGGN